MIIIPELAAELAVELAARRLEPEMKEVAAVPAALAVEAAALAALVLEAVPEKALVVQGKAPAVPVRVLEDLEKVPVDLERVPVDLEKALVAPVRVLAARALAETQERAPGTVPPQNN